MAPPNLPAIRGGVLHRNPRCGLLHQPSPCSRRRLRAAFRSAAPPACCCPAADRCPGRCGLLHQPSPCSRRRLRAAFRSAAPPACCCPAAPRSARPRPVQRWPHTPAATAAPPQRVSDLVVAADPESEPRSARPRPVQRWPHTPAATAAPPQRVSDLVVAASPAGRGLPLQRPGTGFARRGPARRGAGRIRRGKAVADARLPGVVFLYNGQELGLPDVDLPDEVLAGSDVGTSGAPARPNS